MISAWGVSHIFEDHGRPKLDTYRKEIFITVANRSRLQAVNKRAVRWYEANMRYAEDAEASSDEEHNSSQLLLANLLL